MTASRKYAQHPTGIECIDITEHMRANVARAVQLLWTLDEQGALPPDEALERAIWYLIREKQRRRNFVTVDPHDLVDTAQARIDAAVREQMKQQDMQKLTEQEQAKRGWGTQQQASSDNRPDVAVQTHTGINA